MNNIKTKKRQEVNYDVSGGSVDFEKMVFEGSEFLGVQINYTSLNQSDSKIRLQESIDGLNFVDSIDGSGSLIEITLNNTINSDIINVSNFNTLFFRLKFIQGTTTAGTIDSFHILTQ